MDQNVDRFINVVSCSIPSGHRGVKWHTDRSDRIHQKFCEMLHNNNLNFCACWGFYRRKGRSRSISYTHDRSAVSAQTEEEEAGFLDIPVRFPPPTLTSTSPRRPFFFGLRYKLLANTWRLEGSSLRPAWTCLPRTRPRLHVNTSFQSPLLTQSQELWANCTMWEM